ncbi:MAG: HAD-IC family P-type ATPase [Acidimicrobiia bacterium]|nr:HAD-IC family P-type ATPase [Acidimicrobiia bacterium]
MEALVAPPVGLTSSEAADRQRLGLGNTVTEQTSRPISNIIRANLATRFNAIMASLATIVLLFGHWIDALFAVVAALNSAIGIVQEIRAKRSLDAVQVLVDDDIGVYREGSLVRLPPSQLVVDDVFRLEVGDQVPVDGTVLDGVGLELDESALSGESESVAKSVGDGIRSGSYVVAGAGTARAVRVGADSWARRITDEAREFTLTRSELSVGIDRLLAIITWTLPPMSLLLVWSQLQASSSLADGLIWAAAGVVALIPQGLVLLVSMAMAVAVRRLAESEVIVQELPAVEGLARVDVLCVDKTGTLTTGRLAVDGIEPVDPDSCPADGLRLGLAALVDLETTRSATTEAIRFAVGSPPPWSARQTVSFSSARKWSGADYGSDGTWVLGAPEVLLDLMSANGGPGIDALAARVGELADQARRVLLVARGGTGLSDGSPPNDLQPVGLITLKEEVRPDAADTMAWFARQKVAVKVISGDNPRTVSAVADEIGIPNADRFVDTRAGLPEGDGSDEITVFGRVQPEQKRDIVRSLQGRGHTVAMTGDGVNDIPALKAADIGIAMDTARPATKATAQLVLLDGRFDRMPGVVAEGRRVVANMERVSKLFVTKTIYVTLLVLVIGATSTPFPFLPRHLSVVAAVTIGIPAFVLSFRPADQPCRPGYLRRVVRYAVPAGVVAALTTLVAFWAVRSPPISATLEEARTAATITLTLTGLWILYRLVKPLDATEGWLLAVLVIGFVAFVSPSSPAARWYGLSLPPVTVTAAMVAVLIISIGALQVLIEFVDRHASGRTDA